MVGGGDGCEDMCNTPNKTIFALVFQHIHQFFSIQRKLYLPFLNNTRTKNTKTNNSSLKMTLHDQKLKENHDLECKNLLINTFIIHVINISWISFAYLISVLCFLVMNIR